MPFHAVVFILNYLISHWVETSPNSDPYTILSLGVRVRAPSPSYSYHQRPTSMETAYLYDEDLARKLQEEYDREVAFQLQNNHSDDQDEENEKNIVNIYDKKVKESNQTGFLASDISPVDPSLENSDPNPDIRVLFLQFNTQFFWGKLSGIEVKWSPRMTLCAGLCVYEGRGGLCSVRLSLPLLKLRPRKDLVETLLHEMIHAYLFVTDNDRDHDGHGPQFQGHMRRINKATGANISIYHTFHDEVASYQQHWWRCDGPCQKRRPYFGYVKRAMNRAPSPRDFWWAEHQAKCGGTYTKVKEPEGYGQKKGGKKQQAESNKCKDIRAFSGKGHVLGSTTSKSTSNTKNDTSNIGSSSNPATIFNLYNASQKSKAGNKSVPSTSSSTSGSSIIVNGILQRKKDSATFSLFSEIKSTKALSAVNKQSTVSADVKSQSEDTESSIPQEASIMRRGTESDDDDDLWATDINNIESLPLSSFIKGKNLKNKMEPVNSVKPMNSVKTVNSVNSVKSVTSEKSKPSNYVKKNVNVVQIKRSGTSFRDRGKKPSVCTGGEFYKDKRENKKKKKRYILDELDSNDNLWDLNDCSSEKKREIKTDPNMSPLRARLKEESHIKEEKLSDTSQGEIKVGAGGNGRLSRRTSIHDFVDLSDFDDDEFDFKPSKDNFLRSKSLRQKKSEDVAPSQRSISSFFSASSSKQKSKRKSIFSNVKSPLDTSFCSNVKIEKGVNEELPDIISDNESNSPTSHNKSSNGSLVHDVVIVTEGGDCNSSCLLSNKKLSGTNLSSVSTTSNKTSSSANNIRNYFSKNASQSSSSGSKRRAINFNGIGHKNKDETAKKEYMVIDDLSSSSADESEDFTKAKGKKRSSRDAFSSDGSGSSDLDFRSSNKDNEDHGNSNGLPFKMGKRSVDRDILSYGSGTDSTKEQKDEHVVNSNSNGQVSGDKIACPVCGVYVPLAGINLHLDSCLQ